MTYKDQNFLDSIGESFLKYKEFGARSTQKLIPIHKYVSNILEEIWGDKYDFFFMGLNTKEAKVEGKYYPKDIDVAVLRDNEAVFCLGIKFITSNYKQNANNYFENMMGETANIQANQIPYAHIIIMRYETPYYKKNNSGKPDKIEVISKKDIQKYLNLIFDSKQAHRPTGLCIFLIGIDENTNEVSKTNLEEAFGFDFAKLMISKLSPDTFFEEISSYKNFLEQKD
jgi:hypothetical protein